MKVIDLLNKIAKGEEVPEKIKWGNDEWKYSNGASKNYYTDYEDLFSVIDGSNLNDEVEIIEDEEPDLFEMIEDMKNKPKHIEEVKEIIRYQDLEAPYGHNESMFMKRIIMQQNKIDELTKAVNYLLDKEER